MRLHLKSENIQLSEHLHLKEFRCKCKKLECFSTPVSDSLLVAFEKLRLAADLPLKITSGHRCEARNAATEGSNPKSQHITGHAIDIYFSHELNKKYGHERFDKLIRDCGFVYTYHRPARKYFHMDVRGLD